MPRNPGSDAENRRRRPVIWWLWWWWVWILIIVLAFWFGGWGWWGYGGWWWGRRTVEVQVVGSGLLVLESVNRPSFIGQPFRVSGAYVERKVNNHAYWIAAPKLPPMLAVTSPDQKVKGGIGTGTFVSVIGTVEKPPPADVAQHDWGLNRNGASQLEQQGAYVQASTIQQATTGRRASGSGAPP